MESKTLYFSIYLGDKKLKGLQAKTVETIYKNFNAYARTHGFTEHLTSSDSFGSLAWRSPGTPFYLRLVKN